MLTSRDPVNLCNVRLTYSGVSETCLVGIHDESLIGASVPKKMHKTENRLRASSVNGFKSIQQPLAMISNGIPRLMIIMMRQQFIENRMYLINFRKCCDGPGKPI